MSTVQFDALSDKVNFLETMLENIQSNTQISFIAQMLNLNFMQYFPKVQLLKDEVSITKKNLHEIQEQINDIQTYGVTVSNNNSGELSIREMQSMIKQLSIEIQNVKTFGNNNGGQTNIIGNQLQASKANSSLQIEVNVNNEQKVSPNQSAVSSPSKTTDKKVEIQKQFQLNPQNGKPQSNNVKQTTHQPSQIEYEQKVDRIYEEINEMRSKMIFLASQDSVNQVTKSLQEFMSFCDIQKINSEMSMFVKTSDIELINFDINQRIKQVEINYAKGEELVKAIKTLRSDLTQDIAKRVLIEDFNDKFAKYDFEIIKKFRTAQEELQTVEKKVTKIDSTIKSQINIDIHEIKKDLKLKTYTEETLRIWNNFQNYAEYSDLKDLYQKVLPELSKFEDKVQELTTDCEKVSEIVRRFDEVLSEKASKQNIDDIQIQLKEYVTQERLWNYKNENDKRIDECFKKYDHLEETLDILGQNISKDIYAAVKKATSHLNNKQMSKSNMFSISEEELRALIEAKVDKQEFQVLCLQKSNKQDTQQLIQWIEALQIQLKQISVIQTETAHALVRKTNETELQRNNKLDFITQQSAKLSSWINQFDSQDVNQYFKDDLQNSNNRSLKNLKDASVGISNQVSLVSSNFKNNSTTRVVPFKMQLSPLNMTSRNVGERERALSQIYHSLNQDSNQPSVLKLRKVKQQNQSDIPSINQSKLNLNQSFANNQTSRNLNAPTSIKNLNFATLQQATSPTSLTINKTKKYGPKLLSEANVTQYYDLMSGNKKLQALNNLNSFAQNSQISRTSLKLNNKNYNTLLLDENPQFNQTLIANNSSKTMLKIKNQVSSKQKLVNNHTQQRSSSLNNDQYIKVIVESKESQSQQDTLRNSTNNDNNRDFDINHSLQQHQQSLRQNLETANIADGQKQIVSDYLESLERSQINQTVSASINLPLIYR
eukprot:403368505